MIYFPADAASLLLPTARPPARPPVDAVDAPHLRSSFNNSSSVACRPPRPVAEKGSVDARDVEEEEEEEEGEKE